MEKDYRKTKRRAMRYTAWVMLAAGEKHGCVLSDISDAGARLDVEDSKKIPDDFFLLLSSNGSARRACHVIWRKANQLGVRFERKAAIADPVPLAPKFDADAAAGVPEPAKTG